MDEEYDPDSSGISQEIIDVDIQPLLQDHQNEHEAIRCIIDRIMFGMTMMKGPGNLNFIYFVHKLKESPDHQSVVKCNKRIGTCAQDFSNDVALGEENQGKDDNSQSS